VLAAVRLGQVGHSGERRGVTAQLAGTQPVSYGDTRVSKGIRDVNNNQEDPIQFDDLLHDSDVQFAFTEPRAALPEWDDSTIEWNEMRDLKVPVEEITEFVLRWENLTLEQYVAAHADMQLDPFRMVVKGHAYDVTSEDVLAMPDQPQTRRVLEFLPPTGPGNPRVSDLDIRSLDPDTAVAVYHRSEVDYDGMPYESESAMIIVRRDGAWKVASFTRAPLPAGPQQEDQ